MAQLPSGILSVPRGKLSSSVWIHPRTGVVYSPPPKHIDKRSPLQIEHRRRMRLAARFVRPAVRLISKPIWGTRIRGITPYNFAMGITMADWLEYQSIPVIHLLFAEQSGWPCWEQSGAMPGPYYFWEMLPVPPSLVGRDPRCCIFGYHDNPYRYAFSGWLPWVQGTRFLPGWREPIVPKFSRWLQMATYRDSSGLLIYYAEGMTGTNMGLITNAYSGA